MRKTLEVGTKGKLLNVDGRIAIAIPAQGQDGIPFTFMGHSNRPGSPKWDEFNLDGKPVRINPDVVEYPYLRLADCLACAHVRWNDIPNPSGYNWGHFVFQEKTLCFRRLLVGRLEVMFIDTIERLTEWEVN